jgi:hypothetical protein
MSALVREPLAALPKGACQQRKSCAELIRQLMMHESDLSSAWTFYAKFVFPAVWISGFGLGTILLWFGGLHDRNNALPPLFLGLWILGSTFILWANAGLKRVRTDDRQLLVSNYIREIRIPFSAIMDVRQNRWLNTRPITIYFRDATEFGDRATFIPKWRIQFWRIDPVVDELKQLAGLVPNV